MSLTAMSIRYLHAPFLMGNFLKGYSDRRLSAMPVPFDGFQSGSRLCSGGRLCDHIPPRPLAALDSVRQKQLATRRRDEGATLSLPIANVTSPE
jgi:hypothetical protein